MITLHIILILYENRILSIEPFGSRKDAEARAVQLSSEWYKKEGIEAFGKYQLESFSEMQWDCNKFCVNTSFPVGLYQI